MNIDNPDSLEKKNKSKKISILIKIIIVVLILAYYYHAQFLEPEKTKKSAITEPGSTTAHPTEPSKLQDLPTKPQEPVVETIKQQEPSQPDEPAVDPMNPKKPAEVTMPEKKPAEVNMPEVVEKLPLTLIAEEDQPGRKKIILEYYNDTKDDAKKLFVILLFSEEIDFTSEDFVKAPSEPKYRCEFKNVSPGTSQKKVLFVRPLKSKKIQGEVQKIICSENTIKAKIQEKLPVKLEISF